MKAMRDAISYEKVCGLPMKDEIVLSLNRQELADLLGVHRTALARTLSQLVASGQLSCRKNVFKLLNLGPCRVDM